LEVPLLRVYSPLPNWQVLVEIDRLGVLDGDPLVQEFALRALSDPFRGPLICASGAIC